MRTHCVSAHLADFVRLYAYPRTISTRLAQIRQFGRPNPLSRGLSAGPIRPSGRGWWPASTAVGSIQTLDEATAVSAGVSGLILDALVNDGEFVEYGQPLYRILAASEDA